VRVPFVAGNWKMNKDLEGAESLASEVRAAIEGVRGVDVALCPPFPFLPIVVAAVAGSAIAVGAQNCYYEPEGAFTGEVSCEMIRSTGARYVIVGHSERRRILREDDGLINMKVRAALTTGLSPIFCVGETLEEREKNRTLAVISQQLSLGLDGLSARELGPLTIAYEPVWAIGTGKNATPDQAQDVHRFIRGFVAERFNDSVASAMRIQYGGSVKGKNAAELLGQPDIDGALVGGASLDAKEFAAIVKAGVEKNALSRG
jgi:triosephosphate isomerase (TIM)